jgi:Metallo-peptidase family M12/Reprolysin family propeptide
MKLVFVIFSITISLVNAIPSKFDLHNYMDAEELRFFFGSDKETEVPDYEIIDLPENLESGRESVNDENGNVQDVKEKFVSFKVFDTKIDLHLYPNTNLISPYAKVQLKTRNTTTRLFHDSDKPPTFCHYLHKSLNATASISNCESKEIHGLIFLSKNDTLEILPLTSKLKFVMNRKDYQFQTKNGFTVTKIPHLIKRSSFNFGEFKEDFRISRFRERKLQKAAKQLLQTDRPLVEIALFFDEAFYNFFAPFYMHDNEKLRNLVLAYMNGVQALYLHDSLSRKVDFLIVYIEFMEEQSSNLPHAYGERNALIDNFCQYQKNLNSKYDSDPNHWDMAVYVSALDIFAWDSNGNKNGATMGLATVGGVCNDEYNCVITEFGSINQFGKPYPSSGFTSVYILAHEIGHNLGMSHDSVGNSCPKDGFIMSPSRGVQGETSWSYCSDNILKKLE